MGNHYISVTPVLLRPLPKPRTFEKQVLLPGLWLEHINGEFGRMAHGRPLDSTITEMQDTIIVDIPAYVRGLRVRLEESGVEMPPSADPMLEQEEGWHVEHPLEMAVQDEDVTKLVMMSCILAGAETFIVDRPVLAELKQREGVIAPEFDRWESYRHVWQAPRGTKEVVVDNFESRYFPELDLAQVRHYCEILEPYFRPIEWRSGRLAVALGAFLSYALGPGDGQGYLALMTVFEALLSTEKTEIAHQISERTAFILETGEQDRYDLYRKMKKLYDTRSRLVHGDIKNQKGVITYHKLRLDARMTIVPDQHYFDIFDTGLKLLRSVLQRPDLLALLEKNNSSEALGEYYQRIVFGG